MFILFKNCYGRRRSSISRLVPNTGENASSMTIRSGPKRQNYGRTALMVVLLRALHFDNDIVFVKLNVQGNTKYRGFCDY